MEELCEQLACLSSFPRYSPEERASSMKCNASLKDRHPDRGMGATDQPRGPVCGSSRTTSAQQKGDKGQRNHSGRATELHPRGPAVRHHQQPQPWSFGALKQQERAGQHLAEGLLCVSLGCLPTETSGSSLLCPIMTPWAAALKEGKPADVTGAGTARRPCLASSGCWKGGPRRREGHAPVPLWTSLWAWVGRAEDGFSSLRLTLKYENKHTETLESVRLNHSAGRKSLMQREDAEHPEGDSTQLGMAAPAYILPKLKPIQDASHQRLAWATQHSSWTTVLNLNNKLKYRAWGERNLDQRSYAPSLLWPAQP